jgi:hypothetical protein
MAADQLEKLGADTDLYETVGMMVGATVLEALALELVLKARLLRAGITPAKWHSHSDLFSLLPAAEQQDAELIYQAGHPVSPPTLAGILDVTAKAFERWRYHAEQSSDANVDEMQRAFDALVAPF